jgi:uncharacterized delta-60 repeat protein
MAVIITKNNTYCSVNNTIYLTDNSSNLRIVDCVTNTEIAIFTPVSGDDFLSTLIYNSSNNCIYYIAIDSLSNPYLRVLDCNTNTIISSTFTGFNGVCQYNLILNSALNVIYYQNYNGNYFVTVFDCNTNAISSLYLTSLTDASYNIFTYNPYFETLNIGSENNSLQVINTTTLQTTTYTNVLQTLRGIIYNPLDGYYYLSGEINSDPTVVRYKDGIVYGSGFSNNNIFPKLIPNKSSIMYVGDAEYSLFDTETLRNIGGGALNIDTSNLNIYQVGNLYSFNYINSLVYSFDKSNNDTLSVSNLSAVSQGIIDYTISETGGELNNTGLTISRPISNNYALSSVNYLNPMSIKNTTELVFTAYDTTLNSLHFIGYSLCNFNFTQNKWDNLVEVYNPNPLAMCLNTTNGYLYVCIQTSNTDSFQIAVLNAETYELIELVNTQNTESTYLSYDPIRNLIYSTQQDTILSVIDCSTNTEIEVIDLNVLTGFGGTLGFGVIYVENNNSLYVNFISDGDSGLLVIDADDYALITIIVENDVNGFAYSSAYSPVQNKIYRPLSQGYDVDIIDCATNTSLGVITLTTNLPYNPVYNYIDDKVYFIHGISKTITVLDCATETTSEISEQFAGSINNSFVQGLGFNNDVRDIKIQSDGKILVAGSFTDYDGTDAFYIIRLNPDGSKDNSFINDQFGYVVITICIQSDGKILCGGSFTNYGTTIAPFFIRLNSDGSIDNTLNYGIGFNGGVYDIKIQSDGKILVGGNFTNYNGTTTNNIVRLNSNGSIDTSFSIGTGFNNNVEVIYIQSDGKILVGGWFTDYNGTPANYIIRLNSDGSIDSSFNYGTGFDVYVYDIKIQSDGKILIAGAFRFYDGVSANGIVRLNSNGSMDSSFSFYSGSAFGFGSTVESIQLNSDGEIFCGGNFTDYNLTPSNKLAVLNSDGSYNTNYDFSVGANSTIYKISDITNDVFYIGGLFTSYDSITVSYMASLNSNSSYLVPQTPPQSIVYNGNNNSIVLITDEVATLNTGYSYVYSFDCNTLAETIINKSVPYGNNPSVDYTTYSSVNNNYYILFVDNLFDCYLIVYSGSTNLEISRVLLSLQSLIVLQYCSYNNYVYIGGDVNEILVFDCNTNTELASLPYSGAVGVISNITFNPVNNLLYCAGDSGSIIVFDVTTDLQLSTIPSISGSFYNVSSCVDDINNQIIYATSGFSSSRIIFFDCTLETYVYLDIYSLYQLYSDFVIYNPINNLIYCTANYSRNKSFLLIIDPITQTVIENISLNQLVSDNYIGFTLALNTIENTILIASNGDYDAGNNGILIFDCNTNEITSTNSYKVGTSDFSLSSYSVNIASVFYNSNYNSFVAFHCVFENSQQNGTAISTFTKQNTYSNEAFIPIVESGICNIVRYDCNINRVMETVYTAPAETPYIGKMVYNENNNYLYFIQYETRTAFAGNKSIGVLNLTNNTLITTLYPTLISTSGGGGGSINESFIYGTSFQSGFIRIIDVQSDGKILVGGGFADYNGITANNIIRLNADGSDDTSFITGIGFDNYVDSIVVQSDGKILIGGEFTNYNGTTANRIIRLNSDASIDSSFVTGTGFDNSVNSVVVQSDGKILIGGYFDNYDGISANSIIRLNQNGSIDTSFVYGTGFYSSFGYNGVISILIESNNEILIGGQFESYNGIPANNIIRLNTDGSVNTSFISGTGFSSIVNTISKQSDGKILLGGTFSDYNGTLAGSIIRLNIDGSIDTSFITGTGFDYPSINSISIQSDGKALVGGTFDNYNGIPAKNIVRLNTDGSIDTSFVCVIADFPLNGFVSSIFITSDNKTLIGGMIPNYNGVTTYNIVELYTNGVSDLIDIELNPFSNVINIANTCSDGTTENGNVIIIDCNINAIVQYVPTGNGVEFLTYNPTLNTIAYAGVQQGGAGNFYFGSLTGTSNFTIDGGSVNYDFFVQGLNNDPKKIEEIELIMPQRYLANPVNVQYLDASGISDLKPYLPNIEIDAFQKATNRAMVKFGDEYVMNINTQIVNFILPPLSTTIMIITYTELIKSDMLDVVIYEEERKAKYTINQSLDGNITAKKYWGAKKMPKELSLSSDWLKEMRKRFQKVEVIEYDQPKLAGGTTQTREVYQDLFGFSKQVKAKNIGITKAPKFKKGVKVKLATKKQPIKPVAEDVNVEQVFQDMLRVNAHEIPLEKIIPTEMPIDKKPIKPRPVEMTTEEVLQQMLSVNAHEIPLERIKRISVVTDKQPIKPREVEMDTEQVFQDMLRVNANEIPLEKIIPTEMPIDKKSIKPRPVEMTTEEVFQEMLSVNAHEIKLNRIKVPKIKGVKPIQVQLDDLSPMDVFNRSFEDYGSGYLIGVKQPCVDKERKEKYVYGVYYIKPINDRFTAFRHSGEIPLKIELTADWFKDLKRNFDDIQILAIVKKRK